MSDAYRRLVEAFGIQREMERQPKQSDVVGGDVMTWEIKVDHDLPVGTLMVSSDVFAALKKSYDERDFRL